VGVARQEFTRTNEMEQKQGRLIPFWQGPGLQQMAIDRWLWLQCSTGDHPPALRFYTWKPAAISLGYHQRQWPAHWQALFWRDKPLDLVQRPTGGRAVLHAGDLTYSLVLPGQTGQRRQTYIAICEFLIQGWRSLGIDLHFGAAGRDYLRVANCFATATAADLIGPQGEKFIGSAQAWRGSTVLQHGSMQLQPDPALWQNVFGEPLRSGPVDTFHSLDTIMTALIKAAEAHFQITFLPKPLTAEEWEAIQSLQPLAAN
jgi:lipoate---protein ligase